MTDTDWKTLETYVRDCADEMGLMDWEIKVERKPCGDGANAEMNTLDGHKRCRMWFNWTFRDLEPEQQRYTVIHELMHIHFEVPWEYLRKAIDREPFKAFEHLMEYGIDGIATAFACDFPLIDWSK